jgi:hypothetical protein
MDFIFSTNNEHLEIIQNSMGKLTSHELKKHSNEGGCVVYTTTPYYGLEPFFSTNEMLMVIGDPLLDDIKFSEDSRPNFRSEKIYYHQQENGFEGIKINHCAAIVKWNFERNELIVKTDAWASISIFYYIGKNYSVVSTSPDLIAKTFNLQIDFLSAVELLCASQLSFPNTLFSEIFEVGPAKISLFDSKGKKDSIYWKPPEVKSDISLEFIRNELDRLIGDFYKRLSSNLGYEGYSTLSAGLDTRYLASYACQYGLKIKTITVTPYRNLELKIAKKVANKLDIKNESRITHQDELAVRLEENSCLIPSHLDKSNAHFWNFSLGGIKTKFLLGGYMADTVFKLGAPDYDYRFHRFGTKIIKSNMPWWMVTSLEDSLNKKAINEINQRWTNQYNLLNLGDFHEDSLKIVYPSSRQGHRAHFDAARRFYPIYEPFMSPSILELGFSIPTGTKRILKKVDIYKNYLYGLTEGVLSPDIENIYNERVKVKYKDKKIPEHVALSGAWGSRPGNLYLQHMKNCNNAKKILEEIFPGKYNLVPSQICYQIVKAAELLDKEAANYLQSISQYYISA